MKRGSAYGTKASAKSAPGKNASVFWNVGECPVPEYMNLQFAYYGILNFVRSYDMSLEISDIFCSEFFNKDNSQMKKIQELGAVYLPIFMRDTDEDMNKRLISEMTYFMESNPNGAVVLISIDDIFVDIVDQISSIGMPFILIGNNEAEIPQNVKPMLRTYAYGTRFIKRLGIKGDLTSDHVCRWSRMEEDDRPRPVPHWNRLKFFFFFSPELSIGAAC